MPEIYLLALVICLASGLAIVVSKLKQPLLVSYIAVGALLSAFHIIKPEQLEFLSLLPEVGLAFLLFLVGMELDLREFRKLGKNVLLATTGQVAITTVILTLLGLPLLVSSVIAFSSTILVIKILLEEKELSSLHGKLSVGILLVEDLLAIVFLMFMSLSSTSPIELVIKGILLIWASLIAGKKILPKIFDYCASNSELLLLTSVGWCLAFVAASVYLGFSLPIGAFLAGVSLAQSVYRIQISGRIRPMRDFFIMIFFLDLGTGLSLSGVQSMLPLALGLVIYAVIVKPLVFIFLFSRLGLRIHSAFQTGIYISSISEFSLIVLAQATKQGLLDPKYLSPVIFATVFSFIFSSLLITDRRRFYQVIGPVLKKLEKPVAVGRLEKVAKESLLDGHAVLVGCHRSGQIILKGLQKIFGDRLIVLDFNPDTIEELKEKCVRCLYGDVADTEVLEEVAPTKAKVIISTVRDVNDNVVLLDYLEKVQSKAMVIMTADDNGQAIKLYERGAHYVSLPMNLEGHSIIRLIHECNGDFALLEREKERKLGELKNGQIHS